MTVNIGDNKYTIIDIQLDLNTMLRLDMIMVMYYSWSISDKNHFMKLVIKIGVIVVARWCLIYVVYIYE